MATIDDATYKLLLNKYSGDAKKANSVKKELETGKYDKYWNSIMNNLNSYGASTPYSYTTNNRYVSQNTNPGGTGTDLSYVKPTSYYGSGVDWDYKADISKDLNRKQQIMSNLGQDMVKNPGLFANRADFEKYYHYNERHQSQKDLLDEFYNNGGKFGFNSTQNYYADMVANIADLKNDKKLQKAADTYSTLLPALNEIKASLNDTLKPLLDKLMNAQTKYLQDFAYLRKLQMQYNRGMVQEENDRAAGQAASVGSLLSGQGLSTSAINSSMYGAEKKWVSNLNNIQAQHIKTMKELADAEGTFMNNWGNVILNLTNTQQNALKNWYDAFKTLQGDYDKVYDNMWDEHYNPYEEIAKSQVTGVTESAQAQAKRYDNETNYKNGNADVRAAMIRAYMASFLGEGNTDYTKYLPYIQSAAKQGTLTAAFEYLAKVTGNSSLSKAPDVVNPFVVDNENISGADIAAHLMGK